MMARSSGIRRVLLRAVSYSLIGLLALNADASWAAATSVPQVPGGTLSVTSEPAGADVFVDGRHVGKTPIKLDTLTPGDHQVRIVSVGYLENSRTVSIGTQGANVINVKLTPQSSAPSVKSGGGGKKWIWIGLGVATAGAGAAVLLAGGNKPPVPGTIAVSPTGTGMAGATSFTFSAQGASDPDGDALTYNWTFGDGQTGTGQAPTHTYTAVGTYTVQLSVSDGKKSANAPNTTVTVAATMAGTWSGGREPFYSAGISYTLTQSGTTLSGTMTFSGTLTGTLTGITGTLDKTSYPAAVTLTTPGFSISGYTSTFTVRFVGTTNAGGTSMTGTMTTTGTNLITQPTPITTTFTR